MSTDRIPLPEVLKLKQLGKGLRVDRVFGERVLIEPVTPYTQMDEAKKAGIVIPKDAEERNKPRSSTGIVLQLGERCPADGPIQEGAMVIFSKYAGIGITVDDSDKPLLVLDIAEIVCTLRTTGEALDSLVAPVRADSADVPVQAGASLSAS